VPRTLIVTLGIVIVCGLVFAAQLLEGSGERVPLFAKFGLIPARLFSAQDPFANFDLAPAWITVVTSMFLHSGWAHILINMFVLISFGSEIERHMGKIWFAGGLLQAGIDPASQIPIIGASAAISGVMAASFLANPKAQIVLFVIPMPFYVAILLLLFAHILFIATGWVSGVAWWAHIGGFLAGAILFKAYKET
jgi:rhomboid family protein